MASPINAVLCALVGAAFYSAFGYAIARQLLPRILALGAAPVIGWAVFSAASLPILSLVGFSAFAVIGLAALGLVLAGISLWWPPAAPNLTTDLKPWWLGAAAIAAAILAVAPTLALLPKYSEGGVHLAAPIFDHSKIAIIDAMTRQGLPPVNPVFAEAGAAATAAIAKVTPPTNAELSKPAATTSASVTRLAGCCRRVYWESSSIAAIVLDAAMRCCGTQAD